FYYNGNGNDSISGAGENDTVNLLDITLDQITTESTNNSLKLSFSNGGSLELDTNNGTTFNISGTNYTYNKNENKFDEK
ncbi:MAG: hypothetical protein IJT73_11555, partial [Selenomonadaceae bacterium]|nr:hypothetical protein [Selenomonadaceae bacterium]